MKRKLVILALLLATACAVYWFFRDYLSLAYLAQREDRLRALAEESPILVLGMAFVIYAIVTGLSIPVALPLTLACGWLFGFWRSVVLVSFASTSGATLAFLSSRYLFRDAVQARFGRRLTQFNAALAREGAVYLLTLRMVPVVPFAVVNLVMGLTPIRARTFFWASLVGMLPWECVYLYAATQVPSLTHLDRHGLGHILTWQRVLALVLVGLLPLVIKLVMARFRKTREALEDAKRASETS